MNLEKKINDDMVKYMKEKDSFALSVVRMIKASLQLESIAKKQDLTDDDVISVISKQIKSRKDSIIEFEKGNRTDLVEATISEIRVLENYMPEQMTEEEISKVIDEVFKQVNPVGPSDMGKIMGTISPLVKGKADMGLVNKMIKEKLNK